MPARRPAGPKTPNLPNKNTNRQVVRSNMNDMAQVEPNFRTMPMPRREPRISAPTREPLTLNGYNARDKWNIGQSTGNLLPGLPGQILSAPENAMDAGLSALAAAARSKRLQGIRNYLGL